MWIQLDEEDVQLLIAQLKRDCRQLVPNQKGTSDKWKLAARLALIGTTLEKELSTQRRGVH